MNRPRPFDIPRLLALVLTCVLGGSALAQRDGDDEPTRVLFVGNQFSHWNELPEMVRAIGLAQNPPRDIRVDQITNADFTLEQHLRAVGPRAPASVLREWRPHFVVLQEHWERPIDEPRKMQKFAGKLVKLCRKRKAQPVWFMTWAARELPHQQAQITEQYEAAHKRYEGLLAPVGLAWQHAREDGSQPTLFAADGRMPLPRGSYIAACVIYVKLFGGDVTKFPDVLIRRLPDGSEKQLVKLGPRDGARLRAAAAAALAGDVEPARPTPADADDKDKDKDKDKNGGGGRDGATARSGSRRATR